MRSKALLLAASIVIATPLVAQSAAQPADSAAKSAGEPEKVVEGATPDRVAQVEQCQGQKFESRVEIDPVKKRSTRIKLCANPGASDADWVKTLEDAIIQIEQRNMPPEARQKLIAEMQSEIARYASTGKPAPGATVPALNLGGTDILAGPAERFETSVLPPLPARKAPRSATAVAAPAQPPMRIALKCLERGQTGSGGTCDFFDKSTLLAVRAVEGVEAGGTLRFRRRGDLRGEVSLPPLQAGQSTRVRLPTELCRGVANSRVEIELLSPKSTGAVAARLGPYYLRC